MGVQCFNKEGLSSKGLVLVWDGSKFVGEFTAFGGELNWGRIVEFWYSFPALEELCEKRGIGGGRHFGEGEVVVVVIGGGGGFVGDGVVVRSTVNNIAVCGSNGGLRMG